MNGAPRIAPTPISSASALFVKRIATTGMSVSGVAVPSAARMLPVAPSLIRSLIPSHSTPFGKRIGLSPPSPQLALRGVAEDEGHDERREGVLHLAEPVADDAEHDRDEDVEHAVVQRVRADDRDDHDERGDDRVGHPHDHRKERHREQAEDEREQVAQVDARDETPDEVGMLDEEHGSRLQTPHEEPGHDHGRRR